ncbi:MAG: hypothetical protein A3G41_00255 [Elusimicrobia bacterium RIFCSPLOWO2_12_FULL_59_9]|nr:MAG: hypothetical protein A3G41_00255 [Elusimicrobia bacterium RIFCSPLOWO2_12_FULL_59_9]
MSNVKFFELSKTSKLRQIEVRINHELASIIPARPVVALFQTTEGQVGYSVAGVPVEGGRAILGQVHRTIRKVLDLRRGRPLLEPKHQVKFWIPEAKYRLLAKKARRQSVSPSRLASEFVVSRLP